MHGEGENEDGFQMAGGYLWSSPGRPLLLIIIMGCTSNRYGPTEHSIATHSISTGFEKHPTAFVASVIRERSSCKLVLPGQFQAIKEALKLNGEPGDAVGLNNFYERVTKGSGEELKAMEEACPRLKGAVDGKVTAYHMDELLAVAVLLCKGSTPDKAAALFSLFDEGCTGSLSEQAVEDLFRLLLRLAIDDLQLLLHLNGLTEDVKKYLSKCKENQPQASTSIKQLILKTATSVSLAGFTAQLVTYQGGHLLSASGLRKYAHDLTQPLAPPKDQVQQQKKDVAKPGK